MINIDRDLIYVGEVVKAEKIEYTNEDSKKLCINCCLPLRNILFIPNENNLAVDLLYNSPNYPIFNMSKNNYCLNTNIVITNFYNLSILLKYFEYDKFLNLKQIKDIRNKFFTGKFAKDNCELFGFKETSIYNQHFINDLLDCRSFKPLENSILPRIFFDVLDSKANNSIFISIYDRLNEIYTNIDSFKPHKFEGKIKKLTKQEII